MFLCGFCKCQSQPGETKTLIVVETRHKEYPKEGGQGYEIVKEVAACSSCAAQHNKAKEEIKVATKA